MYGWSVLELFFILHLGIMGLLYNMHLEAVMGSGWSGLELFFVFSAFRI